MHHHLIAIPDTGYTNVVGISDAGDVLRTCLANDVDIVIVVTSTDLGFGI